MITLSKRSAVEPFHAMDILAEANRRRQAGRPVISMAVGQPSHAAPKASLAAAEEALKHGRIGYTDALGLRGARGNRDKLSCAMARSSIQRALQ